MICYVTGDARQESISDANLFLSLTRNCAMRAPFLTCRAARLLSTFPSDQLLIRCCFNKKAWGPQAIFDGRCASRISSLSNLLSARSLLSHSIEGSIEDAARDGPCAHGNDRAARGSGITATMCCDSSRAHARFVFRIER